MKNKKGFEMNFAVMFSIIIGIAILFLTIYFVLKIANASTKEVNTAAAKQLSILFQPMETGVVDAKSVYVKLKEETRIYNDCNIEGNFGENVLGISLREGLTKKWSKKGFETKISNKYIFSDKVEQGKEAYFFSKPFNMPFKAADTIFFTTKKYCFVNAPDWIIEESENLNLRNIKIENCSEETRVCFEQGEKCDIVVLDSCMNDCDENFEKGIVKKANESIEYSGSLIYGAIFSSKEVYECNIKRLMKKTSILAILYKNEADLLSDKCGVSSSGYLSLAEIARNYNNFDDFYEVNQLAEEVQLQNEASECSFWK